MDDQICVGIAGWMIRYASASTSLSFLMECNMQICV